MAQQSRKVLQNQVRPIKYNIRLEPDLDQNRFSGHVDIHVETLGRTDSIQLNCVDLHVHTASYTQAASNGAKELAEITLHPEHELLVFGLRGHIDAHHFLTLHIGYSAVIKENLSGLYKSTYIDSDGQSRSLMVTHMQPSHARRVFPCFDEPALKAAFTIQVEVPLDMKCLSNMPLDRSELLKPDKRLMTFVEGPKMSTYLVALVMGDLESITSNAGRVPITLYTIKGLSSQGQFALDIATKGLRLFEDTFACEYPLPKLDLVAVPDFAAGAMENWGLIIYRTAELLLDPEDSSVSRKKRIAETTFHEVSHSWFGNLVTMEFWDGLWLNEGFATWMSWFAVDKFFPQWNVWQDYVAETLQSALELDSLRSSHPVEAQVADVADIGQVFDDISYMKGSSVLRMISKDIGEEIFLHGVREYLSKHRFGCATTEDLWVALENSSKAPIRDYISVWTRDVGFPVITIHEEIMQVAKGGAANLKITLNKKRYLSSPGETEEQSSTTYPLRVSIRTGQGVQFIDFEGQDMEILLDTTGFYKINVDQTGFYRTAYPEERLRAFGTLSNMALLSVEDRVGIVADTTALCISGHQETVGLLELLYGMKSESDYVVWVQIAKSLRTLRTAWMFQEVNIVDDLRTLARQILGTKLKEIGWRIREEDDEILQQFKSLLFENAGVVGDEEVVSESRAMVQRYATGDKSALQADLRDAAFGIFLANGGDDEFDTIWNIYKNSASEEERICALGNLGCVVTPKLVHRVTGVLLTPEIKDQDLYLPLWCLNTSTAGVDGVWAWAKSNWAKIVASQTPELLRLIVPLVLGGFSTEAQLSDAVGFFSTQDTKTFNQVLEQELEKVRTRIAWTKRNMSSVKYWLKYTCHVKANDTGAHAALKNGS
ncbi:putative aminopeptidase [Rosellinia necatrix]|uniref:Aminopeptidase n=1 Tax=Rosellinia necatrix TaxID=77044 RepID=A0A1W2TTT4_ROSNE|nr:putative aminopeptidase [Rosellinia necatrix]